MLFYSDVLYNETWLCVWKKCNNITQLYRVKIQPAMYKKYDMIVNFSKLISILKDLCNGF